MAEFILLLRDSGFPDNLSPEEMQAIIRRYRDWREGLDVTGQKLVDGEGRVLTKAGVTDGPYAESKEVMAGFFSIQAKDYDDAVRIAETCPHIDFGSIEVRQIEPVPRKG